MEQTPARQTRLSQRQGRGVVLSDLLQQLVRASSDFEGAVLVSDDGLVIAAAWPDEDPAEPSQRQSDVEIGAVATRAFVQSSRATNALGRGYMDRLILVGTTGNAIIVPAGSYALFVVLLKPDAKIGVASFEATRVSQQIAQILG